MRRPQLLVLVTAAALASACGPEADLDLDLRSVSITVPRLVTPAIEVVPPAAGPIPAPLPPLPPIVLPPAPSAPPPVVIDPAPDACPKAGPFDVPALTAGPVVESPPAQDRYEQTAVGAFSSTSASTPLNGPVRVTVTRLGTSTGAAGQRVDAWQVQRVDAVRRSTQVEQYQLVHASGAASAVAPGIYLVGLGWDDPQRGTLVLHAKDLGVQVLPVPVTVDSTGGTQYVGSATDPDTLTTLALVRNVTGRKRVDVCGKLVETFTVQMSGTLTSPGRQSQITWTQQLATAYAGADVEETLTLVSPVDGSTWTRSLRSTTVPLSLIHI